MGADRKWYAVYTRPRWEKKVHRLFEEKRLESYCPLHKVRKQWSDRIKTIEAPLFTSYIFVHATEEEKSLVRMTDGVVNFVYWQGKPAVVRDSEIDTIRKFLNEYDEVSAEPIRLQENSKVTIRRGLFMDSIATVKKVMGKKVQVIIESIGYSLVAYVDKSNLAIREKL